jgi:long-chain acyl-CoA synthetase
MATQSTSGERLHFDPQESVERDTINKIFLQGVDRFNRPDALRHKEGGSWRDLSHREVESRVTRLAAALEGMGVEAGDRIAILSENRPEWALTDFAVLGLGAVLVPIYPTLPANQIAYILNDSSARAVFVSTREQLGEIQEIRGKLPTLQLVASFDPPGGLEGVAHFADLVKRGGDAVDGGRTGSFRERALRVTPDDLATLIYTSGTTGDPKGVMLTHLNIASNVDAVMQHRVMDMRPGEVALSFLPLSHSFERMVDYVYWDNGVTIAYAESIEKLADNLGEVSPHYVAAAPRVFEKIYAKVMGATGIKRKLVMWAKGVGEARVDEILRGGVPASSLSFRIADRLVFSKLRGRTGGRLRAFISGSAPLSGDIARFFFAAGLPVYEGYGLTETSPVISVNRPGGVKLGSVGLPIPGVEVRIAENGEIVVRGPNVMKGYWNKPDATREMIDEEGWLHTGDVGELDDEGYLRITDRIKNIIVTAGGKNIAPQPIENLAAMSPYIGQVVMIGDRRAFPTLLLVPDFENLNAWAAEQGLETGDPEALSKHPKVIALLEGEAMSRLEGLARYERPKKVAILPEELTIESGALTPTMKVKRRVVEERYSGAIEGMYEGSGPA